jgi:DNA-binding NtrC family response regulator
MTHILVVEDEDIIRNALKKLLLRNDFMVSECASIPEAKEQDFNQFDLIISDLRLPGGEGTDLIPLAGKVPVLIMTSYASMRSAVDAMKLGAVDYIAKPFDHNEMLESVQRIIRNAGEQEEKQAPPEQTATSSKAAPRPAILGNSEPMQQVFANIDKVAPTNTTVMIVGETGTGKELVAGAIHDQSPRADKPLISLNCAAVPEQFIEAELFGVTQGGPDQPSTSGIILAADGGTLFLDEIGELSLEAQARLLRVLEEGEVRPIGSVESRKVDLRLIAATQRDLKELCNEAKFREDLFFRINVFQIDLPPLRERGEDIIALANTFLEHSCQKLEKPVPVIPDNTRRTLMQHLWPGNVRELKNAIERAVILVEEDQLLSSHLHLEQTTGQHKAIEITEGQADPGRVSLDDYFVNFVLENESKMSETELAKKLGISRKNLWERRQKLGIPRKKK